MDGIKKLQYLLESHKPWEPDKLAVCPWETGLTPQCLIDDVIHTTTTQIFIAGFYDRSMDN